jgi:L-2-hydroxyglutarate oxidase LhgO
MADVSITVIGGGVVGLAVGAELSKRIPSLYLLERNPQYGQETSSRNSEVIHAGIYYPHNSLKAKLCLEGREMLYDICDRYGIPHRRITKIITATKNDELEELDRIFSLGMGNGAPLKMLTGEEVHALEPDITSVGGILSPSTGIISAHGLMDYFYHAIREHGGEVQTHCTVVGLEKRSTDFLITIEEAEKRSTFSSEWVVNAAGLDSDTIASLAGIDIDAAGYRLHYCRGSYFALPGSLRKILTRLVYPVPTKDSLGVHALLDLGGRLKFGPDVEYLSDRGLDYRIDESKRHAFAESVRHILPNIRDEDLTPDMCGIRPKLQVEGGPARDFIISEESGKGLSGLVNLIGIDSPGLTASPAIAKYVSRIVRN